MKHTMMGACSKALYALALATITGQLLAATVSGGVTLVNSHDPIVSKKKNFGNVVVWLKPLDDSSPKPVKARAEILQKDKRFQPHILVVSKGTVVDFPNLDPIFHNAFSNFEGQIFDIGLYSPGSSKSIRFDRTGIVRVFCNIHPSMSAIIVVVDSPYFTKTDDGGRFSIPNVAPGEYELHLFHERATPETLEALVRDISVGTAPLDTGTVTVSEAGYLPVAHKNKYGRDYPPGSEQQKSYLDPLR